MKALLAALVAADRLGFTTSVVGSPLVYAWREWSVRRAKGYARRLIGSVWALLAEAKPLGAYR